MRINNIDNNHNNNKYEKYTSKCKRLFNALYLTNNNIIDIEDIRSRWIFPNEYFAMAYSIENNIQQFKNRFLQKERKILIQY